MVKLSELKHQMRKNFISLSDYEKDYLSGMAEIYSKISGKHVIREMKPDEFGPISRANFDDGQEESIILYSDGCILHTVLYGEHHYSEYTMDSAKVMYTLYTPKVKS